MVLGTRAEYQAAIRKAQQERICERVTRHAGNAWHVLGTPKRKGEAAPVYVVLLGADGDYACDCPVGRYERPCKHAAAIWIVWRVVPSSRGRELTAEEFAAVMGAGKQPAPSRVRDGGAPVHRSGRGVGLDGYVLTGDDEPGATAALVELDCSRAIEQLDAETLRIERARIFDGLYERLAGPGESDEYGLYEDVIEPLRDTWQAPTYVEQAYAGAPALPGFPGLDATSALAIEAAMVRNAATALAIIAEYAS